MTKLYLVRHGQTEWHSSGTTSGKTDVDLDETGRDQISRVAYRLSEAGINCIYSSPRTRCIEMAQAAAKLTNLEVKSDERLQEMDIGDWDEEIYYPLTQLGKEILKYMSIDPSKLSPQSGESFELLRGRLEAWLNEVSDLYPEGSVAAISHSGPICILVAEVLGTPMSETFQTEIDLASITILDYKGGSGSLEVLNDTSHLEKDER